MSIYLLKPRFQALLRPLVKRLHASGVTANQVTVAACAVSVALGLSLTLPSVPREAFLLVPLWMFLRMALNAVDGMLAREFGQQSRLGAYLNELTDVLADAALFLPFAWVAPFDPVWVGAVIFLAVLTEFAGVLGLMVGATRRYDGPLGKSDRAFVFGALALWVGVAGGFASWMQWLMPILAVLLCWTVVNRVRSGLGEAARGSSVTTIRRTDDGNGPPR